MNVTGLLKLLGVIVENELFWCHQTKSVVLKMGLCLAVNKRCQIYLPKQIISRVKSLGFSDLDYCPFAWSSISLNDVKHLKVV